MEYRREIDGLRALAVIPVILFHAGFQAFSGGFVGVDIFFVISGYLITSIILAEKKAGTFTLINFYERRARRILPALYVVMATSLLVGYFSIMPDEYKNLGQSIVATTLFSNNILLILTSGYWDLASEFKPLLHTWSLGVEEQYYLLFPIFILLAWRLGKHWIITILAIVAITSVVFSELSALDKPIFNFFNLLSRGWEILLGAFVAFYFDKKNGILNQPINRFAREFASFFGLFLIFIAIFLFDKKTPFPSLFTLIPTIGAVFIILFANQQTLVGKLLSGKLFVGVGLVSYSTYLWHQPLFSFLRIFSTEKPNPIVFIFLFPVIACLAYLSWRFIEKPFRNPNAINRRTIFIHSVIGSLFFIGIGLFLNGNYGLPGRAFDSSIHIADMDKRIYNERIYKYSKIQFSKNNNKKLLVIGDSFARDFINITLETFNVSNVDIIYRKDLSECIFPYKSTVAENLFSSADVIVFASGGYSTECLNQDISYASFNSKEIYYVGTKEFGYNLNWLMQLNKIDEKNQYNSISKEIIIAESKMATVIPASNFISLLSPTLKGNKIPITDDLGRMLSTDRSHLTKYGAIYFGKKALANTLYSKLFN